MKYAGKPETGADVIPATTCELVMKLADMQSAPMVRDASSNDPSARRVLLVGGNGFLGRHLCRALSARWQVRVFDRPGTLPEDGVDFRPGDLVNAGELDAAMTGCEAFIYLVHESGLSPYLDSDRLALVRNLDLFLLTLESARRVGVGKVILFSSGGAVYGVPERLPVAETHPRHPISAYGVAKASMEMYLEASAREVGMEYLVVRPSNPYGPGQNPKRLQGAVAVFAYRILRGEPIEIWGEGDSRKDYIFVEDLAEAVALLVNGDFDNRAYNIGSGLPVSLHELIDAIETTAGQKAIIHRLPLRKNDVPEIILDLARIEARTGWRAATAIGEGIRRTVEWIASRVS